MVATSAAALTVVASAPRHKSGGKVNAWDGDLRKVIVLEEIQESFNSSQAGNISVLRRPRQPEAVLPEKAAKAAGYNITVPSPGPHDASVNKLTWLLPC